MAGDISTPPDLLAAAKLPALFIADLHLSATCPETAAAFFGFLSGPARQAGSLFILGDLFEYWAGDDDVDSPFSRDVCAALRAVAANGVAVFFMPGNRDLLAGNGFAAASHARMLPDPVLVRFGAQTLLLSHGDMFCTEDIAYQNYRRQVRDPAWQTGFLAQPLTTRREFIEKVRDQSETAKRTTRAEIMDVNTDAVTNLLRAHDYPSLIHGHTHRPGHHTYMLDGHRCERYVLADWHDHPVWLTYDGAAFSVNNRATATSAAER
ncbi:MAG: UDP-2,3-diacylglucosamine diphosphatase [Azoarcus sp.]|jgi:UDP-2,3-diacylglucosamine hydrolase|nr:UDP-2,3-diacylglucosamine diphosphatase [Azoarcus sp.]